MKFPVMTQKKKILSKVLLAAITPIIVYLIVILSVSMLGVRGASALSKKDLAILISILAFSVLMQVITIILMTSYVRIDEKGVTLVRCGIRCVHISWDKVCRVETFESLYRPSAMYPEIYINVLTSHEASWGYIYKRSPQNLDKYSIAFAYDYEAYELIKQYYAGKIYA